MDTIKSNIKGQEVPLLYFLTSEVYKGLLTLDAYQKMRSMGVLTPSDHHDIKRTPPHIWAPSAMVLVEYTDRHDRIEMPLEILSFPAGKAPIIAFPSRRSSLRVIKVSGGAPADVIIMDERRTK